MTLCIVWRTPRNVNFASDSQLSYGTNIVDAAIKVYRVPFSIYRPGSDIGAHNLIMSGDLGMTCAGSGMVALMMKEALSEVVRNVQGVPSYHNMGMASIADLMFRGFKAICCQFSQVLFEGAAVTSLFAGYCAEQHKLRAYRMTHDKNNNTAMDEVLLDQGDMEVFGSGEKKARELMPTDPSDGDVIEVLAEVIADTSVAGVGGKHPIRILHRNAF